MKRKIKKSEWIAIAGAILLINGLTLWCIDVSLSALIQQSMMSVAQAYGGNPVELSMETGLVSVFKANPQITYHLALYLNILVTFVAFMIIIHVVVKDEEEK